ncbi:MAG: glycosyltransferase family 4 protein [Anaerolineales bacterium]|nr:glycosyltransferase family 4 protein [Anaerolineales bacterium]
MKHTHIIVVEPANGGGLVHFSYQLCNALSRLGAEIELITGSEYELDSLPHLFRVNKMLKLWKLFENRSEITSLNSLQKATLSLFRTMRRGVRAIRAVWAWIRLTIYILRVKPNWVIFSVLEYPFQSFFIWLLKTKGIRLSQICHEFEEREGNTFINKFFHQTDKLAYRSFSKIFFLSDHARGQFLTFYPTISENATYSIPHGNSEWLLGIQSQNADAIRRRFNIEADDSIILFFGLLAPSKGIEDLIQAFALASKDCHAKLMIAGYPTKHMSAESLTSLAATLNISDKVIFDFRYVPSNEIGALMEIATVAAYPYHTSTQSGALQIAYTFGKPVIATRAGGIAEVVEDGKSGFLVSPHAPIEIAEKIIFFVKNPQKVKEMGKYAKHLSQTRFAWDTVASQILSAYDAD